MKGLLKIAIGVAAAATTFGAAINISTGTAAWQVSGTNGSNSASGAAVDVSGPNSSWAGAPSGSQWVSWNAIQGTSCVVGQTPGNGCANTSTSGGDTWVYTLTLSAAQLGATSGTVNFEFGSDDSVSLYLGGNGASSTTSPLQYWNQGGPSAGFNPLGCSNPAGATSAASGCTTSLSFDASYLQSNGSLVITAQTFNAPIPGCPQCGNPSGFVLDGSVLTNASVDPSAVPEPATFGMVALAGIAGLMVRRKQRG